MIELDADLRAKIEKMVYAIEDADLSPLCHNATLDETCGKLDPFEEVRTVILGRAWSAAALAVEHERELVCDGCGQARVIHDENYGVPTQVRWSGDPRDEPQLDKCGDEWITRAQYEFVRRMGTE